MMAAQQIMEAAATAMADDERISAWCVSNFGAAQTVFVGMDEQHPPDPDTDYPVIVITGIRQTRGDSDRELSWEIEIGAAVKNDATVTVSNTTTYTGFGQAETLREMAEDAIFRAGIGTVGTRAESGASSAHPYYVSGSVIPITVLKSNRRAMPGS